LETAAQPVDVMVKISSRVNSKSTAKGKALEVFSEGAARGHVDSVDQEWNDSYVLGKCLSDLEPNKIGRVINTARTIW
jgi:hypothetical protein